MTTRGGRGGGRGGRGAGHDMRKRQRQSLDDPVSVPRRGYFFEHDDRGSNRTSNNPQQHLNARGGDLRSGFRSSSDTFHYRPNHREEREVKWGHDKFEELQAEEEEGGLQQQHHQKDNRSRRRKEDDDEEEKRKGKEDRTRRKGGKEEKQKSAAKNGEKNEQTNKDDEGEEAEEEL